MAGILIPVRGPLRGAAADAVRPDPQAPAVLNDHPWEPCPADRACVHGTPIPQWRGGAR